MNIKHAKQVTGISKRNLRFYEEQGLIYPLGKPGNDYRKVAYKKQRKVFLLLQMMLFLHLKNLQQLYISLQMKKN